MNNAVMKIEKTNIIENRQNTNMFGIINIDGPTLLVHCTFLDNDRDHRWFYVLEDGYIDLIDCTIDSDYTTHTVGVVYVYFIQPFEGMSFINALKHFLIQTNIFITITHYCNEEFDHN